MNQLAIIKDIHIGVRDYHECICWFTVDALDYSSLQVIPVEQIAKIMTEKGIYKLEDLNGAPCVVDVNDNILKFICLK